MTLSDLLKVYLIYLGHYSAFTDHGYFQHSGAFYVESCNIRFHNARSPTGYSFIYEICHAYDTGKKFEVLQKLFSVKRKNFPFYIVYGLRWNDSDLAFNEPDWLWEKLKRPSLET